MSVTTSERVAEVLDLAADKLKVGWTTGTAARDAKGCEVWYSSAAACAWCSSGAIWAAGANEALEAVTAYRLYLFQRFGVLGLANWNDDHCPDQATAVTTMREAAKHVRAEAR